MRYYMQDDQNLFVIPKGTEITHEFLKNRFGEIIINLQNECYNKSIEIARLRAMLLAMPANQSGLPINRECIVKTMAQAMAEQNGLDISEWEKYKGMCENAINVINDLVRTRAAETAKIMGRSWGYQWPELGDAIAEAILKGE